jgi:hypothetical protein
LPDWLRPDQAGLIFLPSQFIWQGRQVDIAVPVGEAPQNAALEWCQTFAIAQQRLLIYRREGDWYAFGPPAFQDEMHARMTRGEKLW